MMMEIRFKSLIGSGIVRLNSAAPASSDVNLPASLPMVAASPNGPMLKTYSRLGYKFVALTLMVLPAKTLRISILGPPGFGTKALASAVGAGVGSAVGAGVASAAVVGAGVAVTPVLVMGEEVTAAPLLSNQL